MMGIMLHDVHVLLCQWRLDMESDEPLLPLDEVWKQGAIDIHAMSILCVFRSHHAFWHCMVGIYIEILFGSINRYLKHGPVS